VKQIRQRLTYANVMSTIAVFLVLGGASALAAAQLGKNTVGAKQLKKNAVTTAKIKNGAVNAGKLAAGSVGASQLGQAAVTAEKLAANAVGTGNLTDGSVSSAKLGGSAVTNTKLDQDAVTTGKITDGAVTGAKLATQYLPAATVGVPVAGANISASGTVRKSFNRFGGAPTVEKGGTGIYNLTFPGLEEQALFTKSIAIATLAGGIPGEITRSSAGNNPQVNTFTSAGVPVDQEFEFVLVVPGS
jgi:hypothetical protein